MVQIGKVAIVSGRFTLGSQKPAGQSNYLFDGLPAPNGYLAVVSVYSANDYNLIINADGYLTSNLAVPAGSMQIAVAYVTQ